jgi:hypothetical protein
MLVETGIDIDIVTGQPLKPSIDKLKTTEMNRQARAVNRYQDLINDLSGNGGEVVKQVAGLFADRINALIKEDPACTAYQAIFDNIGIKINIGKRIIKAKRDEIEELV